LCSVFDVPAITGQNAPAIYDRLSETAMYLSNKRELLTGIQYLLIGLIALGAVIHWFDQKPAIYRMLIWLAIAAAMSIIRYIVLSLSEWTRKDDWQKVSRRNW